MKGILITSSLLILLIAALRPLLRGRIDPRVQYALWLAVALRLLIPVNLFTSAYSALALLERADRGTALVETIGQAHIPAQSYDNARAQVVEEYRRQGVSDSQLTPGDLMAIDTQARELMKGPTLAELEAKCARPVWLGGAALTALWFTAVNLKLRRRLRGARRLEIDCPLPVYLSDALPSPCLAGALRPKIYVTPAALDSPERLRHVLAHELAHYRHRDHWWPLVRCACLCLYWFDPLAWWAAALSRQDCELACDEGAIRALGEGERIPYGRTLVGMIAAGRTPLLRTATTMSGGKRRVKERITLIARKPKTVIALALAAALILACAVGCAFSGAPEKPTDPQRKPQLLDLPSRLLDVPEVLRADVVALPGGEPTVMTADGPTTLAQYWMNRPYTDYEVGWGWLMTIEKWNKTQLEQSYTEVGPLHCFATDGNFYYVTVQSTSPTCPVWEGDVAEIPGATEVETKVGEFIEAVRAFIEKTVLETEGVEPFDPEALTPEQTAIQAVINELNAAPGTAFTLNIPGDPGTPFILQTQEHPSKYWALRLGGIVTDFNWEKLTEQEGVALLEQAEGTSLMISPLSDSPACIYAYKDSPLVIIRTAENKLEHYRFTFLNQEDALIAQRFGWGGPYPDLRQWFDEVELTAKRVRTVDNRGQSHHDIAHEWALNYESALTKAAPGGNYSCTFIRVDNVQVDLPKGLTLEELEKLVQSHNFSFSAEDFGKTWFGFSYDLVFVPENELARQTMMAGNTIDYEGGDAPEGAMTYSRRGFLWLTDEGWTCAQVGTGW